MSDHLVHLHDLTLDDIAQIEERNEANIRVAIHERDRFKKYADVLEPILREHVGWTWGDAVRWLERQGPLPDLD